MKVDLYTRKGCHLCDIAKVALENVRVEVPFELKTFDIDEDPALRALYDWEVPVIFVEGRKHAKFRVDEAALRRRLLGVSE